VPYTSNEIRCTYSDSNLNELLARAPSGEQAFSRHFNQVEEFFVRIGREYLVPQLPIHHDVRRPEPERDYLVRLREVLAQLVNLLPQMFRQLSHLFDPAEILKPCFFKLYSIEGRQFLYLLRVDLAFRPHSHRVLVKGSNDFTPAYSTRELHLEALFVPLAQVEASGGRIERFRVDPLISSTWVDETGRGYFVQGIWMDNDLTRFFSRLLLPPGRRLYPFFPYACKYRTVCQNVIRFSAEGRRALLPQLDRVYAFLKPHMPEIEASMKGSEFSEANPTFRRLRETVPEAWTRLWENIKVEAYLNEQDQKEFRVDDPAG
jgi:hypothetical protein